MLTTCLSRCASPGSGPQLPPAIQVHVPAHGPARSPCVSDPCLTSSGTDPTSLTDSTCTSRATGVPSTPGPTPGFSPQPPTPALSCVRSPGVHPYLHAPHQISLQVWLTPHVSVSMTPSPLPGPRPRPSPVPGTYPPTCRQAVCQKCAAIRPRDPHA